jgi:hypothetical protein
MIDDLPAAPDPAGDSPSVFSTKAAAMVVALKNMVVQLRAAIASFNIALAGSANKIPYTIDLGTTMADPGAGFLRLNAATQNAATAIALDVIGGDAIDYTGLLASFALAANPVLGTLRIEKQGDASKFLVFSLTAMTTPTGYRQLTVACIGYSSASPFAQGDPVVLSFSRAGNQGAAGSLTQVLWVSDEKASGTPGGDGAPGTYVVRTLNTIKKNSISGASLASNQITLPAGTYRAKASAIAAVNAHRLYLYNVTDNVTVALGSTQASGSGNTASVIVESEFVLAAAKVFELRHWISTNITSTGLGSMSSSGMAEVYAQVFIEKAS